MARETQININVETKSAVSSILHLKRVFDALNESKKKLSPEGKVELGFAKGEATTINGVAKAVDKVIVSLKTLNEEKQKIAPNGDIRFNFSFGNKEELIEMSKYIKQIGSAIKLYNKGVAEMQKDGKTLNVVIKNTTETINNNSNKLLDLTRVTNMATKATRAKTQANKDLAKSEASVTGAKVGTAIGGETVAPTSSGVGSFATQSLIKNFKSSTKATDGDTKAKVANTRAGNANSKATMQNAMALSMMVSWIRSYSQAYAELSSATFAVGIAGQMSISQIDGLNRTFLNMSATVPSSAKELALATDALIRTGRSFEESRIIIAETAMLASASGSNLKDTAEVVTKVMVALDINAERTSGTLNTMHSTAIQTASDMKYLAEAFKNVAGSASVLVKSSGLGGKELDDYKQRILDVSMASIGSMANLGVSASSAGTKVKQMLGRLVSAEKVAKTMFNTSMELSAIKFDPLTKSISDVGQAFNFSGLEKLAKQDAPKALEVLSQLTIQGKLGTEALQKMFTARHFMEIANVFLEMNGDVNTFSDNITKGISYSNDFYKSLFDINKQAVLLKQNLFNALSPVGEGGRKSLTGTFMAMNEALVSMNSILGGSPVLDWIASTSALTTVFTVLASSVIMVATAIGAVLFAKVAIIAGVISAITTGLGFLVYDAKKSTADLNTSLLETLRLNQDIETTSASITNKYEFLKRLNDDIGSNRDFNNNLVDALGTIGQILKRASGLSDILKGFGELKKIAIDMSNLDRLMKESSSIGADLKGQEESFNTEVEKAIIGTSRATGRDQEIVRKVLANEMKLKEQQLKEGWSEERVIEERAKSEAIIAVNTDKILPTLGNYMKDAYVVQETMTKNAEKLKKVDEEISTIYKNKSEAISSQEKVKDILKSKSDTLRSERLLDGRYIETSVGKQKGFQALTTLNLEQTNSDKIEQIKEVEKNIETLLNNQLNTRSMVGIAQMGYAIDENKSLLASLKETSTVGSEFGRAQEFLDRKFVETSTNLERFQEIITLEGERKKLGDSGMLNESVSFEIDKYIYEIMDKAQDETDDAKKREADKKNPPKKQTGSTKKADTEQKIKYNNFLKENLDLELELLKVGTSKFKQDQLSYEYKMKQIKAEQDLMTGRYSDLEASSQALANKGFDSSKIKTSKQGQDYLRNFYEANESALKGASGSAEKAIYELVQKYVKELSRVEEANEKYILESVKKYSDIVEGIPSQWQDVYSVMKRASELGLAPRADYDSMANSMTSSQNNLAMSKINGDFGGNLGSAVTRENLATVLLAEKEELAIMAEKTKATDIEGIQNLNAQQKLVEGLIDLQKRLNEEKQREVDAQKEALRAYEQFGSFMSKLSSVTGIGAFEDIGNIATSFKGFSDIASDPSKSFDIGSLMEFNSKDFSKNFANAMESAMAGMNMGASIGSMVGTVTGNQQSASAGGALGGMIAGAGGTKLAGALGMSTGMTGAVLGIAGSLLGGMFDDGSKDQAEADKRSAEQKKIYDKNTEALQKLANNMASLGSGIDGLNSSLISSFSKIPTFGNLTNVTDTLGKMYSTMEKTRLFESVAYQYTKTKKGSSGFLGIGAKQGTTEIKTVEFSVQEMLNKYGFKGKIEDMTTDQMRDFSKWLDNFDMGDSDNFSILGDAIEEYAEALDQFDKNIEKFFYDTTMESFVGISSMQQEELRQQIEDFYKNLGFQIDDAMRETIDEMAESMSVMVTIMGDVRSGFVETWRDSGKNAGDAFLSSMKPYIDAMLDNMSQVFYDVYFSDVTTALDKEFKTISEALVELKKQGSDMKFEDLAGALSGSFSNVISIIKLAQTETANFNDILLLLQQEAFASGLTLSEMVELGLVTGTQKNVIDSFKEALTSGESEDAFSAIGDMVGEKIGNALADKMIDNMMSDKILEFSANLDKIVSGSADMTFDSLAQLAQQSLSTSLMLESEQKRLSAIKDMFDFNKDITYQSQDSDISYETGTSSSVVNNFYLSSNIEAGNVIEADDLERLTDAQMDIIIQKLEDRGIYIG